MARRGYLETIEDARLRAKRFLPRQVYMALYAGSQAGVTFKENVAAFSDIYLRTQVGGWPGNIDTSARILSQDLSLPVILSPVGAQAIRPRAEVLAAQGAADMGTAMGLSSFATEPIEDVVAVNSRTFFQLFWVGSRDQIEHRLERAQTAGAAGLIVTLDWNFVDGRDWGSPFIPEKIDLKSALRYGPQAVLHPAWLFQYLRRGQLPQLGVPNLATPERPHPTFMQAYVDWMGTPFPTWEDLAWVRSVWDGPLLIKGILRTEDARRAVDIGADAISVSNHGGNDVDTVPPTVAALPSVVRAVGGEVEVLLDGGVRRGSDVIKAMALGAKGVLIGRGYLWALAAKGRTGVWEALAVFKRGIESTIRALGIESVSQIGPQHVIVPRRFWETYGVSPEDIPQAALSPTDND